MHLPRLARLPTLSYPFIVSPFILVPLRLFSFYVIFPFFFFHFHSFPFFSLPCCCLFLVVVVVVRSPSSFSRLFTPSNHPIASSREKIKKCGHLNTISLFRASIKPSGAHSDSAHFLFFTFTTSTPPFHHGSQHICKSRIHSRKSLAQRSFVAFNINNDEDDINYCHCLFTWIPLDASWTQQAAF